MMMNLVLTKLGVDSPTGGETLSSSSNQITPSRQVECALGDLYDVMMRMTKMKEKLILKSFWQGWQVWQGCNHVSTMLAFF